VELIVQPGAKDAVRETGVRGDLPPGRRDTRGVERAKVHVKALYFPSPVTWNPVTWQVPLRAVAHHPTGINLRMTDGIGNRERTAAVANDGHCPADCVRSVYLDLAVGAPAGHIGQHIPIRPPHITDAATHRAEPIYICRLVCNRCRRHNGRWSGEIEGIAQNIAVSFESALKIGLKPHDN